ncbi:MAG: TonB-dependent receptor [Terriglobia bacterium]
MRSLKLSFLACLALMSWTLAANAQTVQGVVTGTVFDPSRALLPNATVTLTNEGTSISQNVVTGPNGLYRFPLVAPGSYSVSVKAQGFATMIRAGVVVSPSQTVALDMTLAVAKEATTIEVSGGAPLVSTATANLASTVDNLAILSAPLVSRSIYDLTFVAPQVVQGMSLSNPASGGGRESSSTYMLNGADNNDNVMNQDFLAGSNNITPPIESVSEFTMLTNDFSAQYGRGGGVVVSVEQKSGSNKFHGALYEFHRDRSLDASDFFSNRAQTPKPKYLRNQFGGEIDGPIVKDKTFFAFAYDQIALRTGSDTVTAEPTAAELAAITASAGPIASYYLKKYPPIATTALCPAEAINAPAAVGHIGCVHFFDPIEYPERNYYGRVDHNFSERDRLSFSANVHRYDSNDKYGGGYPSVNPISFGDHEHYHNLALVETHTFSSRLLNELTIAHNRHSTITSVANGKDYDPGIVIDGDAYSGLGFGFGPGIGYVIYNFTQERFQLQDNATLLVGRHSIKFGGGWQYGILTRNHDEGVPGYYEFGNDLGPDPATLGVLSPNGTIHNVPDPTLSNFEHDFPYFEEVSIDPRTGARANNDFRYLMNDNNFFVQDDFKLKPHFTLNLGLRWDRYGAPSERDNYISQLLNFNCVGSTSIPFQQCLADARVGPVKRMWNTRNGDFGPRVGFAWDVFGNGRTSLRGGYGIFYDRLQDMVWSNSSWNPPFYALLDSDATSGDTIFYSVPAAPEPSYVPNSIPSPGHRVSLRTMENNLKDASYQNFYLGVEHQLFQNMLLRVNYQGSLGRHLPVLMYYNRYDGDAYNATLTPVFPNALYTGFNYRADNVSSNYNALSVEVQKRLSKGLHFQTGYTWSHLLDTDSELFSGSTAEASSQPFYYISNAHENLQYGNGAFDHRHSIKVLFTYELPLLRQQQGIPGKILGGWQLSSFYQGYSGYPLEVYNSRSRFVGNALDANGLPENLGGDYNLDGEDNDHPDFIGGRASSAYSHANPADGIFKDNHPIGCGFAGAQSTNIADCNAAYGVVTPNSLFANPTGTGVRFGTLGRNVFYGPWYNELDAGIYKNFKVTERVKMQFRAEGINLPNHPDFGGINTNLNSGSFGLALNQSNAPRRIQFGLRVLF